MLFSEVVLFICELQFTDWDMTYKTNKEEMKKYKLGDVIDVTRGTSLKGAFYATEGKYIRLTCGNFDYRNNCFKLNNSKGDLAHQTYYEVFSYICNRVSLDTKIYVIS